MPRTVITGGAGFVGSHLCDRFLAEGHEVVCVDNFITGNPANVNHLRQNQRFDAALRHRQVKQAFFVVPGGHTWVQWRNNAWQSIEVASAHLAHG